MFLEHLSHRQLLAIIFSANLFSAMLFTQAIAPADGGAPAVSVSHVGGKWIIAGKTNVVTVDASGLSIKIQNGSVSWSMVASGPKDMVVKSGGKEFNLRLANAKKI